VDCNSLDDDEHKVLAALCALPGKSVKEIPDGYWDAIGVELVDATRALNGLMQRPIWISKRGPRAFKIDAKCNCQLLRLAKVDRKMFEKGLRQPQGATPDDEERSREVIRSASGEHLVVEKRRERTFVRSLTSQPLRRRGGSEEADSDQSPTSSYGDLAGRTVSGRRVQPEVAARQRRKTTTKAWMDTPVERWNSVHLTGYFDEQTWLELRNRSADRINLRAMLKHMAMLRREGLTNEEIKQMVDVFVQREASTTGRVPSVWRRFIAQRGTLATLLTSNASRHYNNQPTNGDGEEGEDRWL
jgi:hypothetical protein